MKRNGLIAVALAVCATIVLVAVAMAIIRHANNKQNVAWCHDHGYTNYATSDGFCVGAGGKLVKVGTASN
jgi:DhnA family fructose-bisphosphate aldolase class Ia